MIGSPFGSHFGRVMSSPFIRPVISAISAVTRKFLTFGGSEYITVDAPVALTAGDTVSIDFVAAPSGLGRYLVDTGPSGAGRSFAIIEGNNTLDFLSSVYSAATLDGVAILDGADITAALDGALHTLTLTVSANINIGIFGGRYSAESLFSGILANVTVVVSGVPRTWAIGSGSTATDDGLTHVSVVDGDWSDFTLNESTSPDQWEEESPGTRIIPITGA